MSEQATVLIVEDDPGVIRLQQLRLERAGYRVCVATTATAALDYVRKGNIDLILLDQNLPGGSTGLDLYAQIKGENFDIPAILVTGFGGDGIVLDSLRAGVFDFVPKTTDYLDYLLPTIDRVLKKRHTARQLTETQVRLTSMIRSALDAVLTVDHNGNIVEFNPAAEQLFGTNAAKARGMPVVSYLQTWQGKRGDSDDCQAQRWESECLRADGSRFPCELSASWVEVNSNGFWTLIARDTTERKRAQEERERLISEQAARKEAEAARKRLEAIVEENNRLYRELSEVDKLKDQFLAMLSHELRNPLAPIRNTLELIRLEMPSLSKGMQENWGIIDRQVTHLVRLVEDLLDINRINSGKIVLQKEPLDLRTVVTRAVESSRPLIDARRHDLHIHMPEQLGGEGAVHPMGQKMPLMVDGDLVRLVQVLANLLNNAAKYTLDEGRIDLTVERAGETAVIRVRDTGMGFSPEMKPRLFDLFAQSERTLARAEGGLGVGLSLVRRLTEMHGGSVDAASDGQGKGSEFIVRLPLLPEGTLSASPKEVKDQSEKPARRILVVDDNADSARTLGRLLGKMGHEVSVAGNGPEALEAALENVPEVVILDIGLPGMDGYEVAKAMRGHQKLARTVLIALTGYGSPEDRLYSQHAGFNAHMVKPVDLDALIDLLGNPLETLLGKE